LLAETRERGERECPGKKELNEQNGEVENMANFHHPQPRIRPLAGKEKNPLAPSTETGVERLNPGSLKLRDWKGNNSVAMVFGKEGGLPKKGFVTRSFTKRPL